MSLNMMAKGSVLSRWRAQLHRSMAAPDLIEPTVWDMFSLSQSVQPGMTFTGQWGVSWDVFVIGSAGGQAYVGEWGHNWNPSPEQGDILLPRERSLASANIFCALEPKQHMTS